MTAKKKDEADEVLTPETDMPPVADVASPEDDRVPAAPRRSRDNDLITLSDEERAVTAEAGEDAKWNYLAGAAHRHMILTGIMSGTEDLGEDNVVAVIDFLGIRILVPAREMFLAQWPENEKTPVSVLVRLNRMLGATVDILPMAVDMRNRAAVASRKAAMLDRQKRYYASGRVKPGIKVACRVVGVGNNAVTVEALGVESVINAAEVSYDWFADIANKYSSGDLVVAQVLEVEQDEASGLYSVRLSIKAAQENMGLQALRKLVPNANYFGVVTGVRDGTIFVRLQSGCNAKTKLFRTLEIPSKNDTVSFHVRGIDETHCLALGLITRIIKRHTRLQ